MRSLLYIIPILLTIYLFNSCSENRELLPIKPKKGIQLELVIDQDTERVLDLDRPNLVYVILKNYQDTSVIIPYIDNLADNKNLSFIIKTNDSTYVITWKQNIWAHNIGFDRNLESQESMIFNCNIIDYRCYFNDKDKRVIRGDYYGWRGLPDKAYKTAEIKAIYDPTDSGDTEWPNFPKKYESEYYKIRIDKQSSDNTDI